MNTQPLIAESWPLIAYKNQKPYEIVVAKSKKGLKKQKNEGKRKKSFRFRFRFRELLLPLHPLVGPDGGIGRRAGLKHQWGNPCRFDPGSGYNAKRKQLTTNCFRFFFLGSYIHSDTTVFFSPQIIINYSIVSPEYYASFPFLASMLADKWLESNPQSLVPSLLLGWQY